MRQVINDGRWRVVYIEDRMPFWTLAFVLRTVSIVLARTSWFDVRNPWFHSIYVYLTSSTFSTHRATPRGLTNLDMRCAFRKSLYQYGPT